MIARERLYLSASGRVVREGDPAAATLLAGIGGTVPIEYIAEVESLDAAPVVESKAVEPVANKAEKSAANKKKPK